MTRDAMLLDVPCTGTTTQRLGRAHCSFLPATRRKLLVYTHKKLTECTAALWFKSEALVTKVQIFIADWPRTWILDQRSVRMVAQKDDFNYMRNGPTRRETVNVYYVIKIAVKKNWRKNFFSSTSFAHQILGLSEKMSRKKRGHIIIGLTTKNLRKF